MRIVRVRTRDGFRMGVVREQSTSGSEKVLSVGLLPQRTLAELLEASSHEAGEPPVRLSLRDLCCLGDETTRMFCVGHNYRAHIEEMGRAVPEQPTVFDKLASSLTGPFSDVAVPGVSAELDFEAELAVVVGTHLEEATSVEATAAIAGYALVNDVTARDWQRRSSQWFLGKNLDAVTPFGPWMATLDELPTDDRGNVAVDLTCHVNGELRQSANTADLVFTASTLLAYLSQCIALRPGDVVATGTPGGVGAGAHPPRYLAAGDVVEVSATGLGTCRNRFVRVARGSERGDGSNGGVQVDG